MKNIKLFLLSIFLLISCKYVKPAFRFSNFYGTPAENIAKAIDRNDIKVIRDEVLDKHVNVDFKDKKYEVSLLVLAIANDRKEAFDELLKLGANPNIENSYCVSPLVSAIRNNHNCNLYYVRRLLVYGANIQPELFKKCNRFTQDPINETILHYSDENKIKCGSEILNILTTRLDDPDLLYQYNNPEEFDQNIVYNCLSTIRNLSALKYLIVDLKYKVPKEIFIDGTVILNSYGYKSLKEILENDEFVFKDSEYTEKAKKEILAYLNENEN